MYLKLKVIFKVLSHECIYFFYVHYVLIKAQIMNIIAASNNFTPMNHDLSLVTHPTINSTIANPTNILVKCFIYFTLSNIKVYQIKTKL